MVKNSLRYEIHIRAEYTSKPTLFGCLYYFYSIFSNSSSGTRVWTCSSDRRKCRAAPKHGVGWLFFLKQHTRLSRGVQLCGLSACLPPLVSQNAAVSFHFSIFFLPLNTSLHLLDVCELLPSICCSYPSLFVSLSRGVWLVGLSLSLGGALRRALVSLVPKLAMKQAFRCNEPNRMWLQESTSGAGSDIDSNYHCQHHVFEGYVCDSEMQSPLFFNYLLDAVFSGIWVP